MYNNIFKSLAFIALVGLATACNSAPEKKDTEASEAKAESKEAVAKDASNAPVSNETANASTGDKTTIEFEKMEFNFGEIKAGEKVNYKFKFKNTGKSPLIIQDAKASCGCTVPNFTKDPVEPNGTGEIAVSFDSAGKEGAQTKTVTVTSNAEPATTTLTIKGFVKGATDMKGPLANPSK